MENVDIYFMLLWNTLRQYGIFCGRLVYPPFGMFYQEISGNPDSSKKIHSKRNQQFQPPTPTLP
jgi:hypothetical protein